MGTHRLLSKDVRFHDLGLVIIDEEQRFGVTHKEKLKELSRQVDTLTLSATPIPRTLNMALSGIRDMSTIEVPPVDRQPVQTYVLEHDWGVLQDAMSRELEEIKAKVAASKVSSLFDNAEEVGGVKIASAYFTGTTGDTLRGMCDSIRDKAVNPCVAVLVGKTDDKITMAVTVNKLAQEKGLKAGVLVKEISAIAGGKGGGKPDFAMAGLKEETKIDEALAAVKGIVEKQLG